MKALASRVPGYVQAAIEALRLHGPAFDRLDALSERDWTRLIEFCDHAQLTLPLALLGRPGLPVSVNERFADRLTKNAERWKRTQAAYVELANALQTTSLDFLVLKGFSQCPLFVSAPELRVQYDIDLLVPLAQVKGAAKIASALHYEAMPGPGRLPVDHLPAMIRKTGWQWKGDYFDPKIPLSLDLHFRLWDYATEQIAVEGLVEFWERRVTRTLDELRFTALDSADALGYSALHLVRHLLRGDVRGSHVYEVACFLDRHAQDESFWTRWAGLHPSSLRRIEALAFALAREWFHCSLSTRAQDEIADLPPSVLRWFDHYSFSPLSALFAPNKDELWLHLDLVAGFSAKASIIRRRLLPLSLPGPVDAVHTPEQQLTLRLRIRRAWRYAIFVGGRALRHAAALPGVALSGAAWMLSRMQFGRQYLQFLTAAALFNFGLFLFFLLYNLYLLQIGFAERELGLLSSAMLTGSIAGTLPASLAIQRFGTRNVVMATFLAVAALSGLRASVTGTPALIVLAFLAGMVAAAWPVAISPAVSQLTNERNRPAGFSFVFASGIAIGILGGFVAGQLPGWVARALPQMSKAATYRGALYAGCAFAVAAVWPLTRLRLDTGEITKPRLRWPGPQLRRFLLAGALWNAGTGFFNPLFNVFFARLKMPVEQIGLVFSFSQLAQVAAILVAPLVLARLGLVRFLSGTQLATAAALLLLSLAGGPSLAAVIYGTYMVFQYMNEPAFYTLLMDCVPPSQRSEASALNFLVAFTAQAIAAALAGMVAQRFGYPPLLWIAGATCCAAGILFRTLFARSRQASAAETS